MKSRSKVNLFLTGVWLILAMSFTTAAQKADEAPEVLLERAIQLETMDGDLGTAIELYKQIAADSGNRKCLG